MDFPEFYKELEAELFGAGPSIQLELILGKTPSMAVLDIIFIKGFTCSRWFMEQVRALLVVVWLTLS
ncbi:hypothetical protein Tco_1379794 [Tanacetum coccineum]